MIIGAAYLRCSDPRQDKSIEQQRDEIQKRATADGVTIPPENWFIDEGLSGRSSKKRKSYLALIARAETQRDARFVRVKVKAQPIDRLYVWAISRVARNMYDALRALATLDDANIEVVSLTEQDTGDKSMRKLIRPILAWLAERYSEELSKNVKRGMASQAEKGFWQHGYAPSGYEAVPVAGGGSKLGVTDRSRPDFETVKRIFAEYLKGLDGSSRIAERLTREGVHPPSRVDRPKERLEKVWRRKHMQQILTNPAYMGHIAYDGEVVCRDAHEAAVSEDDFARVQAMRALRDKTRKSGEAASVHPIRQGDHGLFTPWLRCGLCGGRIRVNAGGSQANKENRYYHCAQRMENRAACDGVSIRVEALDSAVSDYIEKDVLTPENVQILVADALTALADQPDSLAAEREALQAEIADLDRRIRLTGAQVSAGILDIEDAKAVNSPLVARRESTRLRLSAMPSRQPLPEPEAVDPELFRAAVLRAWQARPLEERREALDKLVETITLREGGANVEHSCKNEDYRLRHHEPPGPPYGSWMQWGVEVEVAALRRPRGRAASSPK